MRPPPPHRFAHLRLEALESREVPAVNIWLGGDGDFLKPANWSAGHSPIASDDLTFDGSVSALSATLNPAAGSTFAGLHIKNGYPGLVKLPFDLTVTNFEQTSGLISQAASGSTSNPQPPPNPTPPTGPNVSTVSLALASTLTVTGTFQFTGGVLNNSENTGTVRIVGVPSAVMGMASNTVWTGSTIDLKSGTMLGYSGTTIFNNDADLEIHSLCKAEPKEVPTVVAPLPVLTNGVTEDGTKNLIIVHNEGEKSSRTGGQSNMGIIVEKGGTLLVCREDKLKGDYKALGKTSNDAGAPSVLVQPGGKLHIRNGDKLTATNGVVIGDTDGLPALGTELPVAAELKTLVRPSAEGPQTATLDGQLTIVFGDVRLGLPYGGVDAKYATLVVTDKIDYQKGEYKAFVHGDDSTKHDMLHTNDTIKFGADVTVTPISVNPTKGFTWDVIEADKGLVGTTEPTTTAGWTLQSANYTLPGATAATGKRFVVKKN